ncbi:MAG: hypothetical protein EA341_11985 [Mongoliibacter sp.]|nr:MAG: hypothetical protein EA341_11985 [Mongoliibacter sp.]
MFVRKNKIKSGSVSIQIVQKITRTNKIIKTIGIAHTTREEELLILLKNNQIKREKGLSSLFVEHDDLMLKAFCSSHHCFNLSLLVRLRTIMLIFERKY